MNYEEYNTIKTYLALNQIKELKRYLEEEKESYYLQTAKKAFKEYINTNNTMFDYPTYGYVDNKLLLCNAVSIYLLNNDEILTKYYKGKLNKKNQDKIQELVNKMNNLKDGETLEVIHRFIIEEIMKTINNDKRNVKNEYLCYSDGFQHIEHKFNENNFKYAQIFLGNDVKYKILKKAPICVATSKKGEGVILGIKK